MEVPLSQLSGVFWGQEHDEEVMLTMTKCMMLPSLSSPGKRSQPWMTGQGFGDVLCVCGHVCVHVCVCVEDSMCACVRVHLSCSPTLRHSRWPFHNLQRAILHRRLPKTLYFLDFVRKTTTSNLRRWVGFPRTGFFEDVVESACVFCSHLRWYEGDRW